MATLGQYCKAYPVRCFREFPEWRENDGAIRSDRAAATASGVAAESPRLQDSDCLYLHENLVVTDGVFIDEHIIFDGVSDEWRMFCANTLKFEVPER